MADLIQYSQRDYKHANRGYCYILIMIDCFSKMIYARPVKRKNQFDTALAMDSILQGFQELPNSIITDDGKEFYNSKVQAVFRQYGIHHYSTTSKLKAMVAERAIRTIKTRLEKYFYTNNTKNWLDIIGQLVSNYNDTPHRTIGMPPGKVTEKNRDQVFKNSFPDIHLKIRPRLSVGSRVRILKEKGIFEKGYTRNWSKEIYKITGVYQKAGVAWYRITDLSGNNLSKKKYYWELNTISKNDH